MRQLQKVLWTKGTLLTPQHLQLQDRFFEDTLSFQLSTLAANPWGFTALRVDRELLDAGAIALSMARGLFADGLAFDLPTALDLLPEPRPLDPIWDADQESLDVYFAVAESADPLSTAREVPLKDENTGKAEMGVLVAGRNFRILLEGEPPGGGPPPLPLARVTRNAGGSYDLEPTFIPPVLDLCASEVLTSLAKRLLERLSAKSAELSDMRRQLGRGLATFGIDDTMNFWLLYTINTHLPALKHFFGAGPERSGRASARGVHPARFFEDLLSLAGSLTTFSPDLGPRDLPVYDHSNLTECFGRLEQSLDVLLQTVVRRGYESIPLKEIVPSVHSATLSQSMLSAREIYLALGGDRGEEHSPERVVELVKVGAADKVEKLFRRGLSGLNLRYVRTPPSSLPVKADFDYFLVDPSGEHWKEVLAARNIAVYVPKEIPNPSLQLLVIQPPGTPGA